MGDVIPTICTAIIKHKYATYITKNENISTSTEQLVLSQDYLLNTEHFVCLVSMTTQKLSINFHEDCKRYTLLEEIIDQTLEMTFIWNQKITSTFLALHRN